MLRGKKARERKGKISTHSQVHTQNNKSTALTLQQQKVTPHRNQPISKEYKHQLPATDSANKILHSINTIKTQNMATGEREKESKKIDSTSCHSITVVHMTSSIRKWHRSGNLQPWELFPPDRRHGASQQRGHLELRLAMMPCWVSRRLGAKEEKTNPWNFSSFTWYHYERDQCTFQADY